MHPCTWHTPLFVCLGVLLGSASVAAWRLKAAGRLNTVLFGAMLGAHHHHVVCQVVAAAILCMAFRRRLVSLKHAGGVKRAMRPSCRWTAGGWAERGKQGDGLATCRFQAGSKPNGDGSRLRTQTRIHLLLISTLAAAVPKWLWIRRRLR